MPRCWWRVAAWMTLLTLGTSAVAFAQTPSSGKWPGADAPPDRVPGPAGALHDVPSSVALELRTGFGGTEATVVNRLDGPVEVMLLAEGPPPRATPPLPARTTLRGGAQRVLAQLHDGAAGTRLRLVAVPGLPTARPRDVEYLYPLRDTPLQIAQGFGGGFSHADAENLHAVDFTVAPGAPVLAARDGVVMQVESAANARLDPRDAAVVVDASDDRVRGNFIRILHDDGTMALYAHLQQGGVVVVPGARVLRGTIIGFSGNTGLSTAPHLHFVVQANRGMRLESLPFRMAGPDGALRFERVRFDTGTVPP